MTFPMQTVDSSNIEAVGYDADSFTLRVKFLSGNTYEYLDVPAELYDALMNAPSKGAFLGKRIKGQFEHINLGRIG